MALPETMRAMRFHEYNPKAYQVDQVPVPKPAPYELLLESKAAGFCASDWMYRRGDPGLPKCTLPMTASHEPTGVVVAKGDRVKDFKVGDRVASLAPINQCDNCDDCRADDALYCDNRQSIAMTRPGALSDYVIVDSRFSARIPDAVPFVDAAPLTCAGATIFHAIKKARIPAGGSVCIVGLGGLGHLGVQFAKCMGLKVVGCDARDEPLDLARRLQYPPDVLLDGRKGSQAALALLAENGLRSGVDAVVYATGAQAGVPLALDITKKHGTFVIVGVASFTFDPKSMIFRDIHVIGSRASTQADFAELLQLVAEHNIKGEIKEWKFDDVEEMAQAALDPTKAGKSVVVF